MKLVELLRPRGTIDRGTYAVIGVVGFALKHNLDRVVASAFFHRTWGLFNYWVPMRDVARITDLRSGDAMFLETMVALAFPFVWVGVVLTMKRLRSAHLPAPLVALFFVPFLNLLFFLLLCLLPARDPLATETRGGLVATRIVPESAVGSAAISLLVTVPVGMGMYWLGVNVLQNYGWGLFVAVPFTMGFGAALIYGLRQRRSLKSCVGVGCLSAALLGFALLALALEGVGCLIMAMPITLPLAAFGGACGYLVQRGRWVGGEAPAYLGLLLVFVPGVQWLEHVAARQAPTLVVQSSIDIQAPPETVWKQVIAFTEIPPPEEWFFRAGIAYPIRAEMLGSGPGAERHCVFSTGAFVEPIEVWDEPRLLKFSVTSNPPPMEEWSPYSHIEPPHLRGFLVSEEGQFLLTPLPDGGTRLEGTTWYRHGLWPTRYWQLWSDAIIHQIHMRVLKHIKDEAEKTG
jgi:hypothetical protein